MKQIINYAGIQKLFIDLLNSETDRAYIRNYGDDSYLISGYLGFVIPTTKNMLKEYTGDCVNIKGMFEYPQAVKLELIEGQTQKVNKKNCLVLRNSSYKEDTNIYIDSKITKYLDLSKMEIKATQDARMIMFLLDNKVVAIATAVIKREDN